MYKYLLPIPNIVFGIVLVLLYYKLYFRKDLINHTYLFWYGTWFLITLFEFIFYQSIHVTGLHIRYILFIVYYVIKCSADFVLYKAIRSFAGKRLNTNHITLLLFGGMLHIIGIFNPLFSVSFVGIIPALILYIYNIYELNKEHFDSMRAFVTLGFLGWCLLEYKIFFPGDWEIYTTIINILFLVTGLGILGIHLHRIQRERDFYKIEACELSQKLNSINKLEKILLDYANKVEENDR